MSYPPLKFSEIAQSLGPSIEAALDSRTRLGEGCPTRLCEAMRYSLLAPGKRLRPMLTLLAAGACGGAREAAMPAACAVEMIHCYSLIHDDLPAMDDDDLRRGRPTCHKAFDEATAILAGDGLLTFAFEVLGREIQPPAVAAACCAALAAAAGPCGMVGGQQDDIDGEKSGQKLVGSGQKASREAAGLAPHDETTADDAFAKLDSIHRRKTGAMIRVSLRLGALTAGATADQLAALDAYGHRLGLAFQITDDLLDVQSSEAAMGKRVGKDAAHGKLTFPGVLGIDQSVRRARQLVDEACAVLEQTQFGEEAGALQAIARYVLERNH